MTALPPFLTGQRSLDAALVVASGIGQAAAAVYAAFATRDAFAALHADQGVAAGTLVELGMAGLIMGLCLFIAQRRSEALGYSYANALRQCFYGQIAGLPKSRHGERRTGALALRFVGDLSAARLWFGRGLPDVLTAVVVVPAAIVILFALDPALAPAGTLPLGIALLIAMAMAWHLERFHQSLRGRRAGLAISMIERIAVSPELDLMGRTGREMQSLEKRGKALQSEAIARRSCTAALQAILQVGTAVSGMTLIWVSGVSSAGTGITAASLAVLALLAVPLANLATAWDSYCAWRVAREKAHRLLMEKTTMRQIRPRKRAVDIKVSGQLDGVGIELTFASGQVSYLRGIQDARLARCIAGLDHVEGLSVYYGGNRSLPRIAYIGDTHVNIQGSLRRSATLMCRQRPANERIVETLRAYELHHLLEQNDGLDERIAEAGRNLSAIDTLRLDLARAELGEVELLVIDSVRWQAVQDNRRLLALFTERCEATILINRPEVSPWARAA